MTNIPNESSVGGRATNVEGSDSLRYDDGPSLITANAQNSPKILKIKFGETLKLSRFGVSLN